MQKTRFVLAMSVATGLAIVPLAAEAKSHKAKHQSATSSTINDDRCQYEIRDDNRRQHEIRLRNSLIPAE